MALHKTTGVNLQAKLDDLAQVSFRLAASEGHLFQNWDYILNMKRVLPLPFLGPQNLRLEGDTWGLGYNFGLHLKPRSG